MIDEPVLMGSALNQVCDRGTPTRDKPLCGFWNRSEPGNKCARNNFEELSATNKNIVCRVALAGLVPAPIRDELDKATLGFAEYVWKTWEKLEFSRKCFCCRTIWQPYSKDC